MADCQRCSCQVTGDPPCVSAFFWPVPFPRHAFSAQSEPCPVTIVDRAVLPRAAQCWRSNRHTIRTIRRLKRRGCTVPVYLVDQPCRGNARRSTVAGQISTAPEEGFFFGQFRMGLWPKFNNRSAFPQNAKSLDQFFRQMTPNTAPYDAKVNANALSSVFEKTGDAVFVRHSQGCGID